MTSTESPSEKQFVPAYRQLLLSGKLARRVERAYSELRECRQCPRQCAADRLAEEVGDCRIGSRARVASFNAHFGEEAPLTGQRGSGTIFFSGCNLHCQYCQNHDISQTDQGLEVEPEQLADIMLRLQEAGCHNINFVSPSHVVAQILAAVLVAAQAGLSLPLVFNTGGYDSLDTLMLMDGVIDIYMPDMKYADEETARRYSAIHHYPEVNQMAVREMHRQVGDLRLDGRGIASRGLLVRHLVLPNELAGTRQIAQYLGSEISRDTYFNLMDQFRPCYRADLHPPLSRRVSSLEMAKAQREVRDAGLWRLDERPRRIGRLPQ